MVEALTPAEREELAALRDRLQATVQEPAPHEHSLAHARAAIQRLADDLWTLATCILAHATPNAEPTAQQYFERAKVVADRSLALVDSADNNEPWIAIVPRFEEFTAGLTEPHTGDCTAVACPCVRCHAERLYGLPSTVTWNKHTGAQLLGRLNSLSRKAGEN